MVEPLRMALLLTPYKSIFQDKDYLNYRYFHKRAYYLACLASAIQGAGDFEGLIAYSYQNDNPLQPIILVRPISGIVCGPVGMILR